MTNNLLVYITDDQTLFRKGMTRLVNSFQMVAEVKEAANGEELLQLISKKHPDVILLDLEMPVMDGIEAAEKIIARYPKIKIIVLSMHDSHEHVYYLMELGVHAFLLKNAEPEEVQQAITDVVEKEFYQNDLAMEALRRGAINLRQKKMQRPVFDSEAALSEREKEVLLLICRELTMREIGEKLSLSEKTIQNHRARIMDKIGAKNTVGLVKYAYEKGLLT